MEILDSNNNPILVQYMMTSTGLTIGGPYPSSQILNIEPIINVNLPKSSIIETTHSGSNGYTTLTFSIIKKRFSGCSMWTV